MRDLLSHARKLGIRVRMAYLEPGILGEWFHDERVICLDVRLTPVERRCTLAHELGHAALGHRCEDDAWSERRADEYAAQLLVDVGEYARLERAGLHPHEIADELDVTPEVLEAYSRSSLMRLHDATYSRHGTRWVREASSARSA